MYQTFEMKKKQCVELMPVVPMNYQHFVIVYPNVSLPSNVVKMTNNLQFKFKKFKNCT